MKKFTMFACLALALVFAVGSIAGELPRMTKGNSTLHGGSVNFDKADLDTINLMAASNDPTNNFDPRDGGMEPYFDGDFEDANGNPAWNGWTHWDITEPTETHFRVSDYQQAVPGNLAAWCGDPAIAACDTNDVDGGYGNSWHDLIEFRTGAGLNTAVSTTVNVTGIVQHDTEPGYDYTYVSYRFEGQPFGNMVSWDGTGLKTGLLGSVVYTTPEYMGGTDIAVYFRVKSDGGWSDEDCSFPSAGACQIDDVNIELINDGNTFNHFEDFQSGVDENDFGIWATAFPDGVGDFAYIWTGLEDNDPCNTNYTPQLAFIDDDVVIPGTGGSDCINWCYGPGGYIVNTTGGLAGPAEHLHIAVESPIMPWPTAKEIGDSDYDGIRLTFSAYRHEDLSADAPGMFYTWGVRSADTDGSAGDVQDITAQGWQDRNFVYYGGPDYTRAGDDVTDLMNQGRDEVQVQLACYELGWIWYWTGNDGYPAPYFDNVTVKVFPYYGPGFSSRELDMAQDNFPARGSFDMGDLGSHSVRFDSANNISLAAHLRNDPGDTMVVDVVPVRAGAGLDGPPVMHYTVNRNAIFDPFRGPEPAIGTTLGMPAVGISGSPTPGKWAFDLPDTGFLFPGDVLHYYISGTDAIGGAGGTDPQTSTLPSDLTGYGVFGDPMGYNSTFVIHALPTLAADGSHPGILFINDFANRGGENEWYTALNNIGHTVGVDYDVYYVNGPSSGVGNGIGGRSNDIMIDGYLDILYTAGDLGVNTIANGDFNNDAGDDVGTLKAWLDAGGHDIFMSGDELASDLAQAGTVTLDLLENYMGVGLLQNDIRPLIGNQTAPLVVATGSNPVFNGALTSWIAYGGCAGINTFDAVEVKTGSQRIAEFTNPAGAAGAYSYSAATLNDAAGLLGTSRVISMPYDLMFVYTDPAAAGSNVAGRTALLGDVLQYFGVPGGGNVVPVLPGIAFKTSNYPNPFNPSTTINFTMPKTGHLSLKVYNVRGQLVKTLIDGQVEATDSGSIVWDGSNNQGSNVSSGVYFYEARTGGDVQVQKMALVK